MRLLLAALLLLQPIAPLSAGVWDTSTPLNTDPISQGDERIRELKTALQEALRAGGVEGAEAIFPGASPSTAPIFRPKGGKGSTAARPAASAGGLYYNTTTGTIQRSSYTASDTGAGWEDITENAAFEAIHQKVAQSLASSAGTVTLPETANAFNVSGTEAVTSIAGWSAGLVIIKWDSDRIITHSSNLALKYSRSRNVVAGDVQIFEFTGSNAVREISFHGASSGIETGTLVMHAGASCPAGTREADGDSLNRTDFPGLFAAIGTVWGTASGSTFNIPDLRGRFARGYDNGAGNDPDAASRTATNTGGATGDNVGTLQADQFKSHTHATNLGADGEAQGGAGKAVANGAHGGGETTSEASGGNETRPKNVSVLYCIKF